MKCCLAHLLPSGHMVPFCAYNTLYRDGHVPLPPLADQRRGPNFPARLANGELMPPRFSYALFMFLALVVFLFVRRFVPEPEGLRRLPWQKRSL